MILLNKKVFLMLLSLIVGMGLAGCTLVDQVTSTVEYPKQLLNYINNTSTFIANVNGLLAQSQTLDSIKEPLQQSLEKQAAEIKTFNAIEPPLLASELHQQIVDVNLTFLPVIEDAQQAIKTGNFNPETLKKGLSNMLNGVNQLNDLLQQVQQIIQ